MLWNGQSFGNSYVALLLPIEKDNLFVPSFQAYLERLVLDNLSNYILPSLDLDTVGAVFKSALQLNPRFY